MGNNVSFNVDINLDNVHAAELNKKLKVNGNTRQAIAETGQVNTNAVEQPVASVEVAAMPTIDASQSHVVAPVEAMNAEVNAPIPMTAMPDVNANVSPVVETPVVTEEVKEEVPAEVSAEVATPVEEDNGVFKKVEDVLEAKAGDKAYNNIKLPKELYENIKGVDRKEVKSETPKVDPVQELNNKAEEQNLEIDSSSNLIDEEKGKFEFSDPELSKSIAKYYEKAKSLEESTKIKMESFQKRYAAQQEDEEKGKLVETHTIEHDEADSRLQAEKDRKVVLENEKRETMDQLSSASEIMDRQIRDNHEQTNAALIDEQNYKNSAKEKEKEIERLAADTIRINKDREVLAIENEAAEEENTILSGVLNDVNAALEPIDIDRELEMESEGYAKAKAA